MGFLKFCVGKFIKTILLLIVILLLVILSTYMADWMWGVVLFLVIAYVFLRCWMEEYEQQEWKKRK